MFKKKLGYLETMNVLKKTSLLNFSKFKNILKSICFKSYFETFLTLFKCIYILCSSPFLYICRLHKIYPSRTVKLI